MEEDEDEEEEEEEGYHVRRATLRRQQRAVGGSMEEQGDEKEGPPHARPQTTLTRDASAASKQSSRQLQLSADFWTCVSPWQRVSQQGKEKEKEMEREKENDGDLRCREHCSLSFYTRLSIV